jgi:hypothetical protein
MKPLLDEARFAEVMSRPLASAHYRVAPGERYATRGANVRGALSASEGARHDHEQKEETKVKAVLITTQHRGVFAGLIEDDQDLTATAMPLKQARMAIYFGTTRGVLELAETGPTSKSRISAPADVPMLHDITAVFAITEAAWKAWKAK